MTTSPNHPVRLDDLIVHVIDQHPEADSLQHLADAVEVSSDLGEIADHLIGHFVDQARRSGASWTDIGQYMGVSKQAVQKRFVGGPAGKDDGDPDFDTPRRGMFGRFTPRARSVVAVARETALEQGYGEVGTEHVLLGLLSQPTSIAAQAIIAAGPSLEQVRASVLALLEPADPRKRMTRVRFGRPAKKVLELSLREALHLGHNYIGTEHLLLGLLRNDKDRTARLLTGLGVTWESAEASVLAQLAAIVKDTTPQKGSRGRG
jgi:hypothetical protein